MPVVVDSSAIIAIIRGEPERDRLLAVLDADSKSLYATIF